MRCTYEDVHRLVLKMREGSKEARRELIEAHVGLAFKLAQPYDDDEVLSDALVTVVEGVDAFRETGKHPATLPSYLKVSISRAVIRNRRIRRGTKDGPLPTTHNATSDAIRFLNSGKGTEQEDSLATIDLMDQILAVCETEQERRMIYYKSFSMTYAEVARCIHTSTTNIARSMQRLALRFQVQEKLGKRA